MNSEAVEAVVAASASKATYGGAVATGLGWLLSSEFVTLVGLLLGVAGFVVNLWFRSRQDLREQREHELRVLAIKRDARHAALHICNEKGNEN